MVNDLSVALPDAPFMRNGKLFVPLEAFSSRIAGAKVSSDPARHRADIRVQMRVAH